MALHEKRRGGTLAIGLILALLAGGMAFAGSATMPQQTGLVDLRSQANVRVDGAVSYDQLGTAVAGAGDVNGDGRADVLVAARDASNNGRQLSGSVYVVFGQESTPQIDVTSLGERGFRIDGAAAFDHAGDSVAGIGDINGDGRADILIGAPFADNRSRAGSGSAYVVFGKATTTNIDLDALGAAGFRIDGAAAGDEAGDAVAAAGDVNGDGKDDFLVGAPYTDNNSHPSSGSVYVVFGRTSASSIDLESLGDAGFRIDGAANADWVGAAIAGGGDVDGDGKADVLIGVYWPTSTVPYGAGSAYVVFGKASNSPIWLGALGDAGFRIDGAEQSDGAGTAVAGAGDVNGDGRSDVLIGAPGADPGGRDASGAVYVVFGKSSNTVLNLRGLGPAGFRIDGANVHDRLGASLALAGDVNGDGHSDLLLGAPSASNSGRIESGSAYVVFGTGAVDLRAPDSTLRVDGAQVYYGAGAAVAGAGDFNGDGRPDIVVGSPSASYNGSRAGSAYIVYGFGKPELAYDALEASVGAEVKPLEPKALKRTGRALFRVTPDLPAGLTLADGTGVVSGTPTIGARHSTYTVTMTDWAGTTTAPLELTVTDEIPPVLRVSALAQSVRTPSIRIRVSVDEASAIRASGAIRVTRSTRVFALGEARAKLAAGQAKTLTLRLSTAAARLLGTHRRASAGVVVRATDLFGNATTARLSIRLRR